MSLQFFKRHKPKKSDPTIPMSETVTADRQDGSIITTLPTELLLQIFSYLFCLRPNEGLHHRLCYSSAGSPGAIQDYKSARGTCKRFHDIVSSEQAITFHLGDTVVFSLLKRDALNKFVNLDASSDTRLRTVKYLNINCRPAPVCDTICDDTDSDYDEERNPKKILSKGLNVLRKTHLFTNIKIVEIVFRVFPTGTGGYFGTEETGGYYSFPIMSADLGREILSTFVPVAAKLENLRQLLFRQFTPTACSQCETEEWHTVLKRLTDLSLRFYKHHYVSKHRISNFAEQFETHWLPNLLNLSTFDIWLTGDSTDKIVGKALTGGCTTMPRFFNFSKLDCFSCSQIACEDRLFTFLWQHRRDINKVLMDCRNFTELINLHTGFPDWMDEEWPIIERSRRTIFRRRREVIS